MAERVGIVVAGMLIWYLTGLASEAVLAKSKKKTKIEERLSKENKRNVNVNVNKNKNKNKNQQNKNKNKNKNQQNKNDININDNGKPEDEDEDEDEEDIDIKINDGDQDGSDINDSDCKDESCDRKNLVRDEDDQIEPDMPYGESLQKDINFLQANVSLHLIHNHGAPFRDFCIYCAIFILYYGFAAAVDEANGEASLCFQWWPILRKLLKIRTPMPQSVKLHDQRAMLSKTCPSTTYKAAKYIEDTTQFMVDIRVDASMFLLSPRIWEAMKQMIAMLNNFWLTQPGMDYTINDFFEFYDDGSFIVRCGHKDNENMYIDLSTKDDCVLGMKCNYDDWKVVAYELAKEAAQTNKQNRFGFHRQK